MKKKIIALLMTAVLALSACSGKEEEVEETEIKVEATPTAAAPDEEEIEEPVPDTPAEITDEKENGEKTIEQQYAAILLKYKRIQDDKLSEEDVEKTGLNTELIQHAWPWACAEDEVRYLFYDIDENGTPELFITYYNDIVDIYAYDGEKVRYSFGAPYRGLSILYPEGMLATTVSYSAGDHTTTWYKFDSVLGDFFPCFEMVNNYDGEPTFYAFGAIDDSNRDEVEEAYRQTGDYPVWVWEWLYEMDFDEYKELCPENQPVMLPQGTRLADFDPNAESIMTTSAGRDSDGRQDGERFEGTVMLEGMEETVGYEHAKNESGGFELDYEYETLIRYSETGCERFIPVYDDQNDPVNCLEVKYVEEDVDTTITKMTEELSKDFEMVEPETQPLDNFGRCDCIYAYSAKSGRLPAGYMRKVFIIPAAGGCITAELYYTAESAEGYGSRFDEMVNTLRLISR